MNFQENLKLFLAILGISHEVVYSFGQDCEPDQQIEYHEKTGEVFDKCGNFLACELKHIVNFEKICEHPSLNDIIRKVSTNFRSQFPNTPGVFFNNSNIIATVLVKEIMKNDDLINSEFHSNNIYNNSSSNPFDISLPFSETKNRLTDLEKLKLLVDLIIEDDETHPYFIRYWLMMIEFMFEDMELFDNPDLNLYPEMEENISNKYSEVFERHKIDPSSFQAIEKSFLIRLDKIVPMIPISCLQMIMEYIDRRCIILMSWIAELELLHNN